MICLHPPPPWPVCPYLCLTLISLLALFMYESFKKIQTVRRNYAWAFLAPGRSWIPGTLPAHHKPVQKSLGFGTFINPRTPLEPKETCVPMRLVPHSLSPSPAQTLINVIQVHVAAKLEAQINPDLRHFKCFCDLLC